MIEFSNGKTKLITGNYVPGEGFLPIDPAELLKVPVPEFFQGKRLRKSTYSYVGRVQKLPEGQQVLPEGELPGHVALMLYTHYGDSSVAYFLRDRRPKIGTRVGAHGLWQVVELDPEALHDAELDSEHAGCALCQLGVGTPIDYQLEVERWTVVPDDYDPLFE